MDGIKGWGAIFFLLILAYLVIYNADKSASVLNSLGSFATTTTKALQGR